MAVTLFIHCPLISSSDLAIKSLNLYFRDNPYESPLQTIQITHHDIQKSTAIISVNLTKKVEHVLNLLDENEEVKMVYRYLNGKPFITWTIHYPDRIPKI